MNRLTVIISWLFLLMSVSCEKNDEPLEYPEPTVITDPEFISLMQRDIKSDENWSETSSASGCPGGQVTKVHARTELDYTGHNVVLRLLPNDAACDLEAKAKTSFNPSEVTDRDIEELHFEFTFADIQVNDQTELWIEWSYKTMQIKFRIDQMIRSGYDSTEAVAGLIEIIIKDSEPIVTLDGETKEIDFSDGSLNSFELDNSNSDHYFEVSTNSKGTIERTLVIFKFLRVWTFGVPDA